MGDPADVLVLRMRRFLSLPWKILALTLSALLLMTIVLTSYAIVKMDQDFQQQQQKQLELRQQQFEHLNMLLENQLRSWIESFTDISKVRSQPDFKEFAEQLGRHFDIIALHLNVEQQWLFNQQGVLLYASTPMVPARVRQAVQQVLMELQPFSEITCAEQCYKLVLVPVQNEKGDVAVVALSTTLLDMLSSLKQGVGSEVAIVRIDGDLQRPARELQLLSLSNASRMASVFAALSPDATVQEAMEHGLPIRIGEENFLISFLPLVGNGHGYYLALVDDTNKFARARSEYQLQMVSFALACFVLLALLIFYSTQRLSQRLLAMASRLPLLAQRRFHEFRARSQQAPLLFEDELDVLNQSAQQLSVELEQLHQQIEQNTRELENIAMYDLLTGLPNRNMLLFQLKKYLAALEKHSSRLAVLFLDLDEFKLVNDTQGHAAGDQLLIEAAARLRASVGAGDLAARFGGDEFVLVLTDIKSEAEPQRIALEVLQALQQPVELNGQLFYITGSIGIAITTDPQSLPEDLIRQADIAMYNAKELGGGGCTPYNQQMFQRLSSRIQLESDIKEAIRQHQFYLVLQPQIELATGRLIGFEALLRWLHPQRGIVTPDEFITVLENSPQMIELGYWVFRRSFELVQSLRGRGYPHIRLAINLSAGQFLDPKLPKILQALLLEFALSASHFELELTERTLVKNIDATLSAMRQLKAMGFGFSIDDFGTGYSSLSYLKQMPVDVIKIDKSFVFGMLENDADYQIIASTIAMVQKLELKVVAEGVENRAQLQLLKKHKCDIGQGYYFAKPLNDEQLALFLRDEVPDGFLQLR